MSLPDLGKYNYDVVSVLSDSGGFARVYWGVDMRTGRAVAIKEPRNPSPAQRHELEKEAQRCLYLSQNNPRITKLKDFIKTPNQDYLVMEFVEGMTLDEYQRKVTKGPMNERMAIPLFLQILEGVGYIHANGIVHRDIKPSNIMVCNNMTIKLLDMGISYEVKNAGKPQRAVGTPAFMPPEQFQKEPCGPCTDIFALGVTFFSMLTGRLPFSGSSTTDIWNKIKIGDLPDAHSICPYVNPSFQPILRKALQPEPWNRYQTCEDMAKAIRSVR
jgi:serine/threonine-protein kinase